MLSRSRLAPQLQLEQGDIERLSAAALDTNPVTGFTHNFYRYPARFSPALVRATISAFTKPGDLVLDPFVGGGTSLVEALAAGRHAIGTDISALATFVTEVKTTVYSDVELSSLERWVGRVRIAIDWRAPAEVSAFYEDAGYLRHLNKPQTWRLRKAIAQATSSADRLRTKRLRNFARCVVLRTAQWALDGRKVLASVDEFARQIAEHGREMVAGSRALAAAAAQHRGVAAYCINRPTYGLEEEPVFKEGRVPRLVVTSPPYPGLHVLYHRWQVHGGLETPAPFWIAKRLDGDGAAYYTMGDRKSHGSGRYFSELRASLASVAAVCDADTTVVQIVAFAEPTRQLSQYLAVADDVGLQEHFLLPKAERLWRSVPNRKWYASQRGQTSGSKEVVLFHRLKS